MKKGIFNFILFDFIKDIKLLIGLFTGKSKFDKKKLKLTIHYLKYNYVEIFKENYILYLLMIASFLCGIFIASQYYSIQANNAIQAFIDSQKIIIPNITERFI